MYKDKIINLLSNISSYRYKSKVLSKHWSAHQGILKLERKMNLEGAFG